MKHTIFITGGCGFIGSALIRLLIKFTEYQIINIDNLTYAGNLLALKEVADNQKYNFELVDICDKNKINQLFDKYQPDGLIHLAAESHVDRSIDNSQVFIQTNIIGTYNLLENALQYIIKYKKPEFKFVHVSTDEVFGQLNNHDGYFDENSKYDPHSPYSASKASSDLLVKAWHHTYKLPAIITNCSNNYGPYQFPEKLIPLMINNAIENKPLPIYGNGLNVRDWIYVDDHVRALLQIYQYGTIGDSYCIGSNNEYTNLQIVKKICNILDELKPLSNSNKYSSLINFVKDRPGHDYRYAIDATKIKNNLNWYSVETFDSGIKKTVEWFLNNRHFV